MARAKGGGVKETRIETKEMLGRELGFRGFAREAQFDRVSFIIGLDELSKLYPWTGRLLVGRL